MAVIQDPSFGNDVISDTTGNDVITMAKGGHDTINLSGGVDTVTASGTDESATTVISVAAGTHQTSVSVDAHQYAGGIGVYADPSAQIDSVSLTGQNGVALSLAGVKLSADHGVSVSPADVYCGRVDVVSAQSALIDMRNANLSPDRPSPVELSGSVQNVDLQFNSLGGYLDATVSGLKSFSAHQSAGNAEAASVANVGVSNSASPELNLDFSAVNTGAFASAHFIDGGCNGAATMNYAGSNITDEIDCELALKHAVINTGDGLDLVAVRSQGDVQIDTGHDGSIVTLNVDNAFASTTSVIAAQDARNGENSMDLIYLEGNGELTALGAPRTYISTGAGADSLERAYLVQPKDWKDNSIDTIDMGASGAVQSGNVTFRINAYSSLVNGVGAHASVYAGGTKIGEFQSNNTASTGQNFVVTTAAANLTNGELAVVFDNDAFIAATSTTAAQDRNLYVREVEMTNPDGSKQMLWNRDIYHYGTLPASLQPVYDRTNTGAPAGINSAFDGQNTYAYTPNSAGTIGMAWSGALKFNIENNCQELAGIDIADAGNGSDTYLFNRGSGKDLYRDSGTGTGDVDTLKFSDDVSTSQIWLSRDAEAKIHVGIIGTANDAVINGIDQLQAGGKTLVAADFDKLINAMASLTPPPMGQLDLNATQHQKLDTVLAANWH